MVTIYKRADGKAAPQIEDTHAEEDGRSRLGYNPAEEARSITKEDWESTKSHDAGFAPWAAKLLPWNQDAGSYQQRARL